jgi:hypothetical protein
MTSEKVTLPNNFITDPLNIVVEHIPRDEGNVAVASDWVKLCGLDRYNSANVPLVGLYVESDEILGQESVKASWDMFTGKLKAKNMQMKNFTDDTDNWIAPFITFLMPNLGVP